MKLRFIIIGFIGLTLFMTSCKKDKPIEKFVPGEVLFSLHDSVSFKNFYDLTKIFDLKIISAYDFGYFKKTTLDSVDTINTILSTKPYLTNVGWTFNVTYIDSTAKITVRFFDFDEADASDWFQTVDKLKLHENLIGDFWKWGVLQVLTGQEQYWVDKLKEYPMFESLELNHIVYIND